MTDFRKLIEDGVILHAPLFPPPASGTPPTELNAFQLDHSPTRLYFPMDLPLLQFGTLGASSELQSWGITTHFTSLGPLASQVWCSLDNLVATAPPHHASSYLQLSLHYSLMLCIWRLMTHRWSDVQNFPTNGTANILKVRLQDPISVFQEWRPIADFC